MTENLLQRILKMPLEEVIGEKFGRYSKYIIQERALPDARDGLKPVQRRILYAMYKEGNINSKPFRKSAKTVGNVIGNYHPHGDTSVYDAMVRLSQDWKVRNVLVEMHGNNGSVDGDPAAAMRYTEARLSKIASELLRDIDKDTVEHAPNFDDTLLEPTVLPARYPNLLVNGATGISSGYATDIPPHNMSEIIDATIKRIDSPNCRLDTILDIVKGPDFPTGGIVQGKEGIIKAFQTGKGKVIIRSKIEEEKLKGNKKQFVITELPYETNKADLVRKIDDIRIDKKIDGILEVRDESDRHGLRIVIELKKDINSEIILKYLLKNTDLQKSYNYNMVAIADKRPVQMGLLQLIDTYVNHQIEVITKRSNYDLEKAKNRAHIIEGLIKALSVLDEVIKIIRASKDKKGAKENLINRFDFTEKQAEAIVMLQLYRLTNTDVTELQREDAELKEKIDYLNKILSDDKLLKKVLKDELREIKKTFKSDRLTEIQDEIEDITIDQLAMIPKEDVIVTLSRDGYIKRTSLRSFSASNNEEVTMKETDYLLGWYEVNTIDTVLVFTSKGRYLFIPVHELPDIKWKDLGKHISNIVPIDHDEQVISSIPIKDFNDSRHIAFITKNGMVKRTIIGDFNVQRHSKPITSINLKDDDELVNAVVTNESDEIFIMTDKGYALWYDVSEVKIVGSRAAGVKGINLKDEHVVSGFVFDNSIDTIAIITDKGSGKRVRLSEYEKKTRAKRGTLSIREVKSNPHTVVGALPVKSNSIIGIKNKSEVLKLKATELSIANRTKLGSNISNDEVIEVFYNKKLVKVEASVIIKNKPKKMEKAVKLKSNEKKSVKNEGKTEIVTIDDFIDDL